MPLRLKRWFYRINQHEIVLECGFTLWGWAQARLVVDGKDAATATGNRFWSLRMEASLNDTQPAMPIRAVITPGLLSVHHEFWAYGVPAAAPDRASKGWLDAPRGSWPESSPAQRSTSARA